MFHIPMSSPMMKRMLGFLPATPELGVGESCACAGATALKRAAAATSSDKPLCIKFRFIFGFLLFGFGFVLMILFRSYWLCLLLRGGGRPVFRAACVVDPRLSPGYWDGWPCPFLSCSMTWSRL